jgi:hypothetical protein
VSDEIIRQLLAALGEELNQPLRSVSDRLAGLSGTPDVVLLRQLLNARRGLADASTAVDSLRRLADRLKREGLDPAIGIIGLVGDSLDGLESLLATDAVPLPPELQELRLALARLRRAPVSVDLSIPVEPARAALAGQVVRTLVASEPGLAESGDSLRDLESAIVEAVAGAIARSRGVTTPRRSVDVRATLRGDMLSVEVIDCGTGDSAVGWDVTRVRRAFDHVSYVPGAESAGGKLQLRRRVKLWPWQRPGA